MLSTDIDDEELDGIDGANLVHSGLEWIPGRISQLLKHSRPRASEPVSFVAKMSHNIWSLEANLIHMQEPRKPAQNYKTIMANKSTPRIKIDPNLMDNSKLKQNLMRVFKGASHKIVPFNWTLEAANRPDENN